MQRHGAHDLQPCGWLCALPSQCNPAQSAQEARILASGIALPTVTTSDQPQAPVRHQSARVPLFPPTRNPLQHNVHKERDACVSLRSHTYTANTTQPCAEVVTQKTPGKRQPPGARDQDGRRCYRRHMHPQRPLSARTSSEQKKSE